MAAGTWKKLTEGLDDEDRAKLEAFREFCRSLPDVEERIHSADVTYARARSFTSAYIKSHYLEVGIELTREVRRPKPRAAFATTKTVMMHRYSVRHLDEFDESIKDLIREAYETVGPGARAKR